MFNFSVQTFFYLELSSEKIIRIALKLEILKRKFIANILVLNLQLSCGFFTSWRIQSQEFSSYMNIVIIISFIFG